MTNTRMPDKTFTIVSKNKSNRQYSIHARHNQTTGHSSASPHITILGPLGPVKQLTEKKKKRFRCPAAFDEQQAARPVKIVSGPDRCRATGLRQAHDDVPRKDNPVYPQTPQ